MTKKMNVATATTTNSGKSNNNSNNINNVENYKPQVEKVESVVVQHVEFVVNARLFYLDVESDGSWVMYNESNEFRGDSLVDVDVDGLSAWLAENAGQECETQFEFTIVPCDETFLYDRESDGSWSVQMDVDYVDNFPVVYTSEDADLYGLMEWVLGKCEEYGNDVEKTDHSALIEAIENWDAAKSEMAEIMCEVHASEDYYNDKELQDRKYNAESVLITAAKDVEFEIKELGDPTYLIGNRGDEDMMAIWVVKNWVVAKQLDVEEYNHYRCFVLPKYMSEIENWVRITLQENSDPLMSDEEFELGDEDELKSYSIGWVF